MRGWVPVHWRDFVSQCRALRNLNRQLSVPGTSFHQRDIHTVRASCILASHSSQQWKLHSEPVHGVFSYHTLHQLHRHVPKPMLSVMSSNIIRKHDLKQSCDIQKLLAQLPRHGTVTPSKRNVNISAKKVVDSSPVSLQPYMRLLRVDKPIGTYLLFWPCTWSIGLAANAGHLPDLYLLALFGLGSFVMRGSGCIINDMWDRDIDAKVERTKTRPLACGEMSLFQALVFLGGNLSIALTILLQLNWYSVALGASSMGLVVLYPLAKRYTYWPQFVLGLTLNWGVLLAWSALHGTLEWPVAPLYMACVLYTMFYDTIYSHQDKYDDLLIGVKSTALKLKDQTKPWLAGFSGLMISGLTVTGFLCDQTWPYYTAVMLTAAHLVHQLYTVDLDNPDDCLKKFKSNTQLGAIIFLGIVFGTLLKPEVKEEKTEAEEK